MSRAVCRDGLASVRTRHLDAGTGIQPAEVRQVIPLAAIEIAVHRTCAGGRIIDVGNDERLKRRRDREGDKRRLSVVHVLAYLSLCINVRLARYVNLAVRNRPGAGGYLLSQVAGKRRIRRRAGAGATRHHGHDRIIADLIADCTARGKDDRFAGHCGRRISRIEARWPDQTSVEVCGGNVRPTVEYEERWRFRLRLD